MTITRSILLKMRNVSDKSCSENQSTHFILFYFILFFRKSYRLQNKVEKCGTARQATDDNIIRRIRFACGIRKATDKHLEYVILPAFPRQQWVRERPSIYMYIACFVEALFSLRLISLRQLSLTMKVTGQ
jgi:hypothetical protein